jgi:hypothetical protein
MGLKVGERVGEKGGLGLCWIIRVQSERNGKGLGRKGVEG